MQSLAAEQKEAFWARGGFCFTLFASPLRKKGWMTKSEALPFGRGGGGPREEKKQERLGGEIRQGKKNSFEKRGILSEEARQARNGLAKKESFGLRRVLTEKMTSGGNKKERTIKSA